MRLWSGSKRKGMAPYCIDEPTPERVLPRGYLAKETNIAVLKGRNKQQVVPRKDATLKREKCEFAKWKKWSACSAFALIAFSAGSILATRMTLVNNVRADNDRVFELRIYHAIPGKLSVMESRFRDKTSKILARHNLNVVGYWLTEDGSDNSFVFLFAHDSRGAAQKNWEAFRIDPEFQDVMKAEQAEKTLEKADIIWLRPTDFSPMK
jgi:NIPSNAP